MSGSIDDDRGTYTYPHTRTRTRGRVILPQYHSSRSHTVASNNYNQNNTNTMKYTMGQKYRLNIASNYNNYNNYNHSNISGNVSNNNNIIIIHQSH